MFELFIFKKYIPSVIIYLADQLLYTHLCIIITCFPQAPVSTYIIIIMLNYHMNVQKGDGCFHAYLVEEGDQREHYERLHK